MNTVSKYLSLVKFAHTIFAMPFAAVGFVYAYATLPAGAHDAAWWLTRAVQVLLEDAADCVPGVTAQYKSVPKD